MFVGVKVFCTWTWTNKPKSLLWIIISSSLFIYCHLPYFVPRPTLLGKGDYEMPSVRGGIFLSVRASVWSYISVITAWIYFIFKMPSYNKVLMWVTTYWGSRLSSCLVMESDWLSERFPDESVFLESSVKPSLGCMKSSPGLVWQKIQEPLLTRVLGTLYSEWQA